MILVPCLTTVVLGFFSIDDKVKDDHFFYKDQEQRLNFHEGNEYEIMSFVISHFSAPESTILDFTGDKGIQYIYTIVLVNFSLLKAIH